MSVTYAVSGGLVPVDQRVVLSADAPPPAGYRRPDVEAVLDAASDPALRTLQMEPLPVDRCCDRREYVVTVRWSDGSSRTFRTLDGLDRPEAFDRLLRLLH